MKILTLSLIAAFGLAAASPAVAFGRASDFGAGIISGETRTSIREIVCAVVRHFLNFRKETPLTDEQKTAIGKIFQEHRPEIHERITKGRDARREMTAAAKENSSAVMKAAAQKIGDFARDRALLAARIGAEVRPLLTPGQQKQIESVREEIESLVDAAFAAAGR